MKLNLFIAKSGFCSRRDAAVFVKEGKVSVGGKVIIEPWFEVNQGDFVRIGNKVIGLEKAVYLIFNKPKGVTTTLEDKYADKIITDYIPESFGRVFPVGRLDKLSRGLIMLTNDGDLCYRFTHPKFEIDKEYLVTIKGEMDEDIKKRLLRGVRDEGDLLKVKSVYIEYMDKHKARVGVVVREGKKRHIRRLFQILGYEVMDLIRIRIGGLLLGNLKEGRYRILDKKTVYKACESNIV